MTLQPPIEPMLAQPWGSVVPTDLADVCFEPKWDGFRALAYRLADRVVLQGRGRGASPSGGTPSGGYVDLAYAFPEVVDALDRLELGTVVDGEIVVSHAGRLDFERLGARLRPRSEAGGPSIARLATQSPATFLAFDLLGDPRSGAPDLRARAFRERRAHLQQLAAEHPSAFVLTPQTTDAAIAAHWFTAYESCGVDGVMVKPLDDAYAPGRRTQGKIKHERTIDVVVAGWREHTRTAADGSPMVGSLLLGLHDADGLLHYIGGASAFTTARRQELVGELTPLAVESGHPWLDGTGARTPGEPNRWRKASGWHAVRPERVAEVRYDQREGDRLRHAAVLLRWRPDRDPRSCSLDQFEDPPPARIEELVRP